MVSVTCLFLTHLVLHLCSQLGVTQASADYVAHGHAYLHTLIDIWNPTCHTFSPLVHFKVCFTFVACLLWWFVTQDDLPNEINSRLRSSCVFRRFPGMHAPHEQSVAVAEKLHHVCWLDNMHVVTGKREPTLQRIITLIFADCWKPHVCNDQCPKIKRP